MGYLQEQIWKLNKKRISIGEKKTPKEGSEAQRLFRLLEAISQEEECRDEVEAIEKLIEETMLKLGSGFNLYGSEGPKEENSKKETMQCDGCGSKKGVQKRKDREAVNYGVLYMGTPCHKGCLLYT